VRLAIRGFWSGQQAIKFSLMGLTGILCTRGEEVNRPQVRAIAVGCTLESAERRVHRLSFGVRPI
jgi:hypothetical protein